MLLCISMEYKRMRGTCLRRMAIYESLEVGFTEKVFKTRSR